MQKNTVLSKILSDFSKENPNAAVDQLQTFCDYAENWFREQGVVGLGFTQDGMALRFSDAKELLFFSVAPRGVVDGGSFDISGTATQKNVKMPEPVTSFQITGQ
jgi:hypothetical protein